jgi:cytochrome c-type biogenesis protein
VTIVDALPHTSLIAAFLAGLLSFISACVLPIIPSYLISVTGLSFKQSTGVGTSHRLATTVMINSLLFIAGFSILFIGFGVSATVIGGVLTDHHVWIRKSGAVLIVLLGLYVMMGLAKPPWLMEGIGSFFQADWIGYAGSVLVGATFAAGWTPCVGPVLGTMLQYAGTVPTVMDGITLLIFYSLGLGTPLLILSLAMNHAFTHLRRLHPYLRLLGPLSGFFLIVLGGVLYTDRLGYVTALLEHAGIGYSVGLNGHV